MGPRSTSRSISGDDTIVVGQIHAPHGNRGEVRVEPRSDIPGRFRKGAVLDCDGVGPLTITSIRGEPSSRVIHFDGYDTREAAFTLRDRLLRVSREEARRAAKGAYLWADLVGLAAVTPDGKALGIVRDLLRTGATDVLVIIDPEGVETLHPMIDSVVRSIDVAERRIVIAPQEHL
jgi:16S rRNA processing protein RimM